MLYQMFDCTFVFPVLNSCDAVCSCVSGRPTQPVGAAFLILLYACARTVDGGSSHSFELSLLRGSRAQPSHVSFSLVSSPYIVSSNLSLSSPPVPVVARKGLPFTCRSCNVYKKDLRGGYKVNFLGSRSLDLR